MEHKNIKLELEGKKYDIEYKRIAVKIANQ